MYISGALSHEQVQGYFTLTTSEDFYFKALETLVRNGLAGNIHRSTISLMLR